MTALAGPDEPAVSRGSTVAAIRVRRLGAAHILNDVLRVSVVGNSGSGKTTVAAAIGAAMGAPHLELDAVFHQPGWAPLDREEFRRRVAEFVAAPRWVADGNYSAVRDLVWARADTVVWLDPPRHRVMRRIIWRSLSRAALRAELWNGNRERWANLVRMDPQESVIAWAWTRHHVYRQRYEQAMADPANAHLTFIRLRSPREVAALLTQVRTPVPGSGRDHGSADPGPHPAPGGSPRDHENLRPRRPDLPR